MAAMPTFFNQDLDKRNNDLFFIILLSLPLHSSATMGLIEAIFEAVIFE